MSTLGMAVAYSSTGQATPGTNAEARAIAKEQATIKAGMRRTVNIQHMNRNREIKRMRHENQKWSERDQNAINSESIRSVVENRMVTAWGDNMPMRTQHCRILYNNCNGISTNLDYGKCHDIGDSAHEMNVSILGLSETCLDWTNVEALNKCKNTLRKHMGHMQVNQSSSKKTFDTPYQPGGTMTIVRGKWAGRATPEGNDDGMGRWSEVRIAGKGGRAVRIITAYRVCNNNIAAAMTKTAFRQ
jgi:hypothetical protein